MNWAPYISGTIILILLVCLLMMLVVEHSPFGVVGYIRRTYGERYPRLVECLDDTEYPGGIFGRIASAIANGLAAIVFVALMLRYLGFF